MLKFFKELIRNAMLIALFRFKVQLHSTKLSHSIFLKKFYFQGKQQKLSNNSNNGIEHVDTSIMN